MDYYERRRRALEKINEMLLQKKTTKEINAVIGLSFGYSVGAIDKLIEQVSDFGREQKKIEKKETGSKADA